jgi:hypothetical protein
MDRLRLAGAAALAALVGAGVAHGSIMVAKNAKRVGLRVDARGYAEVSWTATGVRRTLLVPPRGKVLPGGRLPGRDVSRRATRPALAFQRALRRTPDGRLWALQAWRVARGGPIELHFSRWKGAPTTIAVTLEGGRLTGTASFQGQPVTGSSPTPQGVRVRHFAFIDCFGCGGTPAWLRLIGVSPGADGSFAFALRPGVEGTRYRATIAGPNRATTLAPDASAVVGSSRSSAAKCQSRPVCEATRRSPFAASSARRRCRPALRGGSTRRPSGR